MDKNSLKISINFNPFSFAGKDFYKIFESLVVQSNIMYKIIATCMWQKDSNPVG